MEEKVKVVSKIEVSQEDFYDNDKPYIELTTRLCYLDYPNLNNVGLSSKSSTECFASIIDMPIVAKIDITGTKFKGHEVYQDKEGNINFGTFAYGTNVGWFVKEDEVDIPKVGKKVVPCYFAKSKVWKRFPKVIEVIKKYMDGDGLYSSWELQGQKFNTDKGYKEYTNFCMLGNTLIGVTPAYAKNSKTLQVASTEEDTFNIEMAQALSEDIEFENIQIDENKQADDVIKESNDSGIENYRDNKEEDTMNLEEKVKELEQSNAELRSKLNEYEGEETARKQKKKDEETLKKMQEKDEEIEKVKKEKAEVEVKVSDKDSEIEQLKNEISEKNDAMVKVSEKVTELETQVSELLPLKAEKEEAERLKAEKELSEKKEQLKVVAMKGGFITKEEIETSEAIGKMIEDLDEKSIKAEIAERFMKKLDETKKAEEEKVETSETKKEEVANANLNGAEEDTLTGTQIVKNYLASINK